MNNCNWRREYSHKFFLRSNREHSYNQQAPIRLNQPFPPELLNNLAKQFISDVKRTFAIHF